MFFSLVLPTLFCVWFSVVALFLFAPIAYNLFILGPILFVAWFFRAEQTVLRKSRELLLPLNKLLYDDETTFTLVVFWPVVLLVGAYLLLTWLRDKTYDWIKS
jgi:hypothetical protein